MNTQTTRRPAKAADKYIFTAGSEIPTHVRCPRCAQTLPIDAFPFVKAARFGISTYCRVCSSAYNHERYECSQTPGDSLRDQRLWQRYGITAQQYEAMLEAQGGVCAICACPERALGRGGKVKRLAVDHCHASGKVRELLCHNCNVALGTVEKMANIDQVAEYLIRHQARDNGAGD